MRLSRVHRILVILVAMFCTMIEGYCQSSSQNYVLSAQMCERFRETPPLAYDVARITIDYYDGLGRPVQNVRVIPTTKEQDVTIRQTFITESHKNYDLVLQNCATAVGKSLSEAGVNVDLKISISKRIPVIDKQIKISELNIQVPSIIYNHIKNNNPGYEIN